MRFQVSRVMDTIEPRLTTDVTWAQAVVDIGEVVRYVPLDGGRPVNVLRIGMVVDALSRFLVDEGAMLYGVAGRELLSEGSLTSKERMVLSRWADDGLIEVTPEVGDRAVEIADLTGMPLIALRPYPELRKRFGWLADGSGRVWRLTCRGGAAALRPMDDTIVDSTTPAVRVIGRAKVPELALLGPEQPRPEQPGPAKAASTPQPDKPEAKRPETEKPKTEKSEAEKPEAERPETEKPKTEKSEAEKPEAERPETEKPEADEPETEAALEDGPMPLPVEVFLHHQAAKITRTVIARRRFMRAEPGPAGASVLAREWRCDGFDCPAFGEQRRIGQPVPRMRRGIPVCPRHGEPITDIGPRPPAYSISVVVDDLPRRRLLIRAGHPVRIGRDPNDPNDPDVVSVAPWLHRAAEAWISPARVRLEVVGARLTVVDLSENGTVVWQRTRPDGPGTTRVLRRAAYPLGEWDSVELYTGIELVRGDRRPVAVLGRDEPASVLLDAPTAAHPRL